MVDGFARVRATVCVQATKVLSAMVAERVSNDATCCILWGKCLHWVLLEGKIRMPDRLTREFYKKAGFFVVLLEAIIAITILVR